MTQFLLTDSKNRQKFSDGISMLSKIIQDPELTLIRQEDDQNQNFALVTADGKEVGDVYVSRLMVTIDLNPYDQPNFVTFVITVKSLYWISENILENEFSKAKLITIFDWLVQVEKDLVLQLDDISNVNKKLTQHLSIMRVAASFHFESKFEVLIEYDELGGVQAVVYTDEDNCFIPNEKYKDRLVSDLPKVVRVSHKTTQKGGDIFEFPGSYEFFKSICSSPDSLEILKVCSEENIDGLLVNLGTDD